MAGGFRSGRERKIRVGPGLGAERPRTEVSPGLGGEAPTRSCRPPVRSHPSAPAIATQAAPVPAARMKPRLVSSSPKPSPSTHVQSQAARLGRAERKDTNAAASYLAFNAEFTGGRENAGKQPAQNRTTKDAREGAWGCSMG